MNMSNKKRILIENFLIYGFGQILYKIIPIIMLPVITRIMPDSSYYLGINDLANTLISLVSILGLMGMYDGMFRLFFDYTDEDVEHRREVCSTALFIVGMLSAICGTVVFLFRNRLSILIFRESQPFLMIVCALSITTSPILNLLGTPTRILNQRRRFIIGNVGSTLIAYVISMVLILKGAYMLAMPLGVLLCQIFAMLYYWHFNGKWFSISAIAKKYMLPLLKIGVPLTPTFLIFWIYSSFDKMMILEMLGIEYNGMFAIADKLAQVSQFITSAFATGWSYYNFSTMHDSDRIKNFSKIINYYFTLGVLVFASCRVFGNVIMSIIFTKEYGNLGDTFAYLFLSPIVNGLFQLMGSQFLMIKKTLYSTVIAMTGVVLNIVLNIVLIQHCQIVGAAIATVFSYCVIFLISAVILKKKGMFLLDRRMILGWIVIIISMGMDLMGSSQTQLYVLLVVAIIFGGILYRNDMQEIIIEMLRGEGIDF